jgi:D-tyrosyl-tRNA(Tyr) deacylase
VKFSGGEKAVSRLEQQLGKGIATGEFGVDMKAALINDGPVTIWIDSKARE